MRVLLYEPNHGGHHLAYVKRMVPAIRGLTSDLIVVLDRGAAQSTEFKTHLAGLAEKTHFEFTAPAAAVGWRGAWNNAKNFMDTVRRWRPDHIYLPYADGLSQLLGLRSLLGDDVLLGAQAEALLMRGAFAYPSDSVISRMKAEVALAALRAAPWERVHFTDPLIYAEVQRRGGDLAARSRVIPDPVEPIPPTAPASARRELGVPDDGRYMGCVGAIDERKGIDLLIDAFVAANLDSTDRLLLVGRQSEAVRQRLQRADAGRLVSAGRILMIDRYVNDADFAMALASMDVVCAPYPRHIGSASIVLHAAAAGKPVLASDWGWMAYVIPRFELGQTIDVVNTAAFASALAGSLRHATEFCTSEASRRFVQFHTVENFRNHWTELLSLRLGINAKPATMWQRC